MTATQYLKRYDFFKQQFNIDDTKARISAEEIEKIVGNKFEYEKKQFADKSELVELKHEVQILRQEMKQVLPN